MTARPLPRPVPAALRAAVLALALAAAARADEIADSVDSAEREVAVLENRLKFVAQEYVARAEQGEPQRLRKRFTEAEIQFLLEDWQRASFLLYDVAENEQFRGDPYYPSALYYLGESLYQQKNNAAARPFFRQAIAAKTRYTPESLLRLVQIADALGDVSGVEEVFEQLRGGRMRPVVQYVYAKWLRRRHDLAPRERITRALEAFAAIAPESVYALQARYFEGVLWVEAGDLARAQRAFENVLALKATEDTHRRVHELAQLGLGRLHYEAGMLGEAIDRYQKVPRESPHYNDALFELAWCHIKKGEYDKALRATELLLMVGKGSIIEPEAQVLQADLLTRLGQFREAIDLYNEVVAAWMPAKEALRELLASRDDAIRFFDTLIKKGSGALEVEKLLPQQAMRYATAQREIAESMKIIGDLEAGRKGVTEGLDLAGKLEEVVAEAKLEIFPTIQEGTSRALEIENSLIRLRMMLLRVEAQLYTGGIPEAIAAEIAERRKEREELEAKFRVLPLTVEDLKARQGVAATEFARLQKQVYQLSYEAESLTARITAMAKWLKDTRDERSARADFDPREERDLLQRLGREREVAEQMEREREAMARTLADQGALESREAGLATGSEMELRARYSAALEKEREALARARPSLPANALAVAHRMEKLRTRIATMEADVASVHGALHGQAMRRISELRRRLADEKEQLTGYSGEVRRAEDQTSTLVGEIAFGSFQKVLREVHGMVLKADVGLVDVAWARKKEKSDQISHLARTRDDQLRALEDGFREVLAP